jgi:hypothetical protein
MSNQIKITEEELAQVRDLRDRIRTNVETIGRLNVQRHFAQLELDHINSELDQTYVITEDLSAEESRVVKEISQKYGDGSLDFETGIYTPKN